MSNSVINHLSFGDPGHSTCQDMENQRHSKVSSKAHLPEELCRDILSRLPVKSLVRFQCVSKSWLSLINDPEFRRAHLNKFKNNRHETHLLAVQGTPQDCVVRCSDTFKTSLSLTLPPRCRGGDWQVECSIDGLVLLKNYGTDNDLVVWNPSIRKFHDIPPLPETNTPRTSSFFDVEAGLGYDPLVKDYKHVKFIFAGRGNLHSVAVYTLGAGSWNIIPFGGKGCCNWHWVFSFPLNAVHLQGSFYFICTDLNTNVLELASFNLSSEVFSSISVPDVLINYPDPEDTVKLVVNGCSSLALFSFECGFTMWAVLECSRTESESLCWTEPCSLEFEVDIFLFLKKNRDVLMQWRNEEAFRLATSKSLVQNCSVVSSYNLETGEEKILLLQKEDSDSEFHGLYGYIESLALLN